MNGSVFSKARYKIGVGFEILARISVPQLPPSYPHEVEAPRSSCPMDIFLASFSLLQQIL